jgi:hypothetical protein
MSMPLHSSGPDDDGIPAADPGAGAPPPAPGFGIGGEEPDVVPGGDPAPEEAEAVKLPEATAFRTPDPRQIGPDGA